MVLMSTKVTINLLLNKKLIVQIEYLILLVLENISNHTIISNKLSWF